MLRSPAPESQLLCVKCGRDTTSSTLPNGTGSAPPTISDRPPAGYHPFLNGDAMDSDSEEHEAGVMQVDPTARSVTSNQLDGTSYRRREVLIIVARREQSDRASKLIGEKLLQGYCLLEEICSTETCYGVLPVFPSLS